MKYVRCNLYSHIKLFMQKEKNANAQSVFNISEHRLRLQLRLQNHFSSVLNLNFYYDSSFLHIHSMTLQLLFPFSSYFEPSSSYSITSLISSTTTAPFYNSVEMVHFFYSAQLCRETPKQKKM